MHWKKNTEAVYKMKQLSPEWFEIRTGKVTASRFKDVINKLKNGKSGAPRINYKNQIIIEKLTHIRSEEHTSELQSH